MIKKVLVAIFLNFTIAGFSQMYEFAPVGAIWRFFVQDWDFFGEPIYYYSTIQSLKDTVIDGKDCHKLNNDMIFYQNTGDSIFRYTGGTSFSLLYDFSAEAGDTFFCEYCNTDVKVESVTTQNTFGASRKVFKYTSIDNTVCNWDNDDVVEGVGSTIGLFSPNPALADWVPIYGLSCYEDLLVGGSFKFNNDPCIVNVELSSAQNFSIYPTLFDNKIYIENNSNKENLEVLILNSVGQTIYSSPLKKSIDTKHFPSGVFLVKIIDSSTNSVLMSTKMVKP
ncbi:MAG: hypothetical protein ACLGGV_06055 [Bacteroidia bacterium]